MGQGAIHVNLFIGGKADVALDNGDLVTATNLCETVILADSKSPQADLARQMLTEASVMRDEFAAHSAETLERSTALFDAGKYAEAKLLLGSLKRSGVALPADQAHLLETYQTRLVALETTRGSLINTAEVAAAMFDDPGVIKRRTPPQPDQYYPAKEEKSQPAPAPATAPATAPAKETTPAPSKTDEKFAPPTKSDPAPAKTVEGTPIPEIKDQPKAQDQPATDIAYWSCGRTSSSLRRFTTPFRTIPIGTSSRSPLRSAHRRSSRFILRCRPEV